MSWDIFVQDLPREAKAIADIPDDFRPACIGQRPELIAKIKEIIPTADFSEPSWGLIDGDNWSIEVNFGASEECNGFALHARGGDEAAGVVAAILKHLNLRAIDAQTGEFFVAADAVANLSKWRGYRDKVAGK